MCTYTYIFMRYCYSHVLYTYCIHHTHYYVLCYIELNYLSKPPLVDWVRTVLTYTRTLPSTAPPLIFQQLFETESSTYTYILADPTNSKYIYCYTHSYTILL